MPIFAALVAAWPLRLNSSALGLAEVLTKTFLIALLMVLGFQVLTQLGLPPVPPLWLVSGVWLFVAGLVVWGFWEGYPEPRTRKQRVVAIALVVAVNSASVALADSDEAFWAASAEVQTWLHPESRGAGEDELSGILEIEPDRLWEAQPGLINTALNGLRAPITGTTNVYGVAVAAQGTQRLFSREAQFALKTIAARFPRTYRGGVLLSNGPDDLLRDPLATPGNLASAAKDIARRMDPSRDVLVVYLASHGGRDAALSTGLPDYQPITPISARAVDAALDGAGIKRRVIIVSACYSGTWIPFLANDDSIVITAAAKDRTSFGCSDDRRLTYFGEAFLEGRLSKGASFQQAFGSARRTIARWEARDDLTASNPQAFVGKNMQSMWSEASR